MSKALNKLAENYRDFSDPDNAPGAIDREAEAQARASNAKKSAVQVLHTLANHLGAKFSKSKPVGVPWADEQATVIWDFTTSDGVKMYGHIAATTGRGYELSISPRKTVKEQSFVHHSHGATLKKQIVALAKKNHLSIYPPDITVPTSEPEAWAMYHDPIRVTLGTPSANSEVHLLSFINSLVELIETLM